MKKSIHQIISIPLTCSLLLWGGAAFSGDPNTVSSGGESAAVIQESRADLEANIMAVFGSQSEDGGYQLGVALKQATMQQLQAMQSAADMDAVQAILNGSKPGYAQRVGDLNKDYTFTPVTPCRVVDTRNTGGFFGLDERRKYYIYGDNMSGQGGASTGCESPVGEPRGAMISMVAVPVQGGGTFTAYPSNEAPPERGSLLNYQFGEQAIVSATSVRTYHQSGPEEIEVRNRFGRAHLVIDILGYFTAPEEPAGVDYIGGDQDFALTASVQTVRSLTVDTPTDGHCLITASGYFDFNAAQGIAICSVTTGSSLTQPRFISSQAAHTGSFSYDSFSYTRGFSQSAGETTYNLVCEEFSGTIEAKDTSITATCTAARY